MGIFLFIVILAIVLCKALLSEEKQIQEKKEKELSLKKELSQLEEELSEIEKEKESIAKKIRKTYDELEEEKNLILNEMKPYKDFINEYYESDMETMLRDKDKLTIAEKKVEWYKEKLRPCTRLMRILDEQHIEATGFSYREEKNNKGGM